MPMLAVVQLGRLALLAEPDGIAKEMGTYSDGTDRAVFWSNSSRAARVLGVSAFMGSMTHGFPNMLFVYGPQAPSGLSNGPSCSELQGDEIVSLLKYMRDQGLQRIESSAQADAS
jgi:cation diffusion facilitator CzcD-associated flavoprotein CzcO